MRIEKASKSWNNVEQDLEKRSNVCGFKRQKGGHFRLEKYPLTQKEKLENRSFLQ